MCIMASENGILIQSIAEIIHLLQDGFALASGGRDLDGRPIITFPDRNIKADFTDEEFRQMLSYYTAVPPYCSPEDVERGFVIIVDRRNSSWNRVRVLIARILNLFPAPIEKFLIIGPSGLFQRLMEKVNGVRNVQKTQMVIINALTELQAYVNSSQLTLDLNGTHNYVHDKWIEHRVAVESLALQEHHIAKAIERLVGTNSQRSFPLDLEEIRALLESETVERNKIQVDLQRTLDTGRTLVNTISASCHSNEAVSPEQLPPDKRIHVLSIERGLARLNEAQRRFDRFWERYGHRLHWAVRFAEFTARAEQAKEELSAVGDHTNALLDDRSPDGVLAALSELQSQREALTSWDQRLEGFKEETEALERDAANPNPNDDGPMAPEWPGAAAERQSRCLEARELLAALDAKLAAVTDSATATGASLENLKTLFDSLEKSRTWQAELSQLLTQRSTCPDSSEKRTEAIAELKSFLSIRPELLDVGEEDDFVPEQTQAALAEMREAMARVEDECERLIQRLDAANAAGRQGRTFVRRESDDPAKKCVSASCLTDRDNVDLLNGNSPGDAKVEDNDRRLQTRTHVMREMVATEKDYVECLERIHAVFWSEIDSPSDLNLNVPKELKEDRRSLFGNWEDLLLFHKKNLLIKLESCAERPAEMGRCFQECQETFEQYSDYCLNKFYADALLARLGGDQHPFIRHCQALLNHSLPLSAFLLKPVQRVQKYQLLLKEMLKNTPAGCEEAAQLEAALNTMLRILRSLNDAMLRCDIVGYHKTWGTAARRSVGVERRFSFRILNSKDLGRLLLHDNFQVLVENKNEKVGRTKFKERHVFLFEKSLLVCKSRLAGKNAEKVEYHFEMEMMLEESGLTESTKANNARRFEVWSNNRRVIITLQAPTVEVKQCWTKRLQDLLLEQFKRLKEKAELRREHNDKSSYQMLSSPSPTSKLSLLSTPSPTTPILEKTIRSSASDDDIDEDSEKSALELQLTPSPGPYPVTQV